MGLSVRGSTVCSVKIFGYCRRSTDEQPTTLAVQQDALVGWASAGGHVLVEVVQETVSGGVEPEDRLELSVLLDRLALGDADALVVTTTDRLARTHAVHRLDYYAARQGWALVILDELDRHVDAEATLLHGIRVEVAQYERALISRRTKAALARIKAEGKTLGRPKQCPDEVLREVARLKVAGARLVDIAEVMNRAGTPTPAGSPRWWPSHVSRLLATQAGRRAVNEMPAPKEDTAPRKQGVYPQGRSNHGGKVGA